jgi:hypothetical protein
VKKVVVVIAITLMVIHSLAIKMVALTIAVKFGKIKNQMVNKLIVDEDIIVGICKNFVIPQLSLYGELQGITEKDNLELIV